jgi:hypothetical protein
VESQYPQLEWSAKPDYDLPSPHEAGFIGMTVEADESLFDNIIRNAQDRNRTMLPGVGCRNTNSGVNLKPLIISKYVRSSKFETQFQI